MNRMLTKIPFSVRYIVTVYLAGLMFFTIFRVILLFTNYSLLDDASGDITLVGKAFIMGFRFDTVISGYLLLLPLAILVAEDITSRYSKVVFAIVRVYIAIVYIIAFFICSADIPFFTQFNARLNTTALHWMKTPGFVIKMIWEEKVYLIYLFAFILFTAFFLWVLRRINRRYTREHSFLASLQRRTWSLPGTLAICLPALALLLLGMRGRTTFKSPIRVGTAYYCNNRFLNQLGLNPVFTFLRSYLDDIKKVNRTLHLADDQVAIASVQRYLHAGTHADTTISPIARVIAPLEAPLRKNVILVVMESMTGANLARFGGSLRLTPTLDSLAQNGYSFDNTYSAGIHTFNGLYSTLFSFPALMNKHSMNNAVIPEYSGLPKVFKDNGYYTLFTTTHDEQFDNLGGFMLGNNFDKVISQKDYPRNRIVNTLGVPDHYMFDFVLPEFDKLHEKSQPFFATLLTTSNHRPYYVPADIPFKPAHKDEEQAVIEYADWSIRHFLEAASKQPWFDNTVFVFIADHGKIVNGDRYEMPIFYHHIPFIIYSPSFIKPASFAQPAGQIDVFPTVMGLLNFTYVNNTFGVDLVHESRPYIYFSADDKVGVIDSSHFYTWFQDGHEALYDYRKNDFQNGLASNRSLADTMKNYAFNSIQAAQWLIMQHRTSLPVKPH